MNSGTRELPFQGSPLAAYSTPSVDPDIEFAHRPYNPEETWPSELGNGGRVSWSRFEAKGDWLEISYPGIK